MSVLAANCKLSYASDCSSIAKHVQQIMHQDQITGMAIAIVNKDTTEYCNYGYANKNKKTPITNKSIFEIASITKTFTALLAGIAVTESKLDLNTPITHYLPELAKNKTYLIVNNQELLTHTSGLPLGFDDDFTEKALINSAINYKFTDAPGSYYRYSNPGISFSGIALSRIYSLDYQNLLNKLILNPLNMQYTAISVSSENQALIVTGYNKNNQAVNFMNIGVENPAGGLKSNTYDLAKYLKLQIYSANSQFTPALKIVHNNYSCLYKNGVYQQLAWEYHPNSELSEKYLPDIKNRNILAPHPLAADCVNNPDGFIEKTGNSHGMTSYMGYIPSRQVGVVILSNNALKPSIVNLGHYILAKKVN